ncbi:MAG: M48 family metalloprotease [Deltaproteobacteria bacterium]|nr:M48 family metalloprotease [Deltaproteobacteria bacterium]MBK8236956.1 M48 family metalloprotease [Deltaproteobacteria bacterium]MBP7289794.1 M48 family metalloprotease [Nannocystaceae bacterium]
MGTKTLPDRTILQARRDRTLRAELMEERDIQYALKKIEELSSGYGFVSRRQLLTGALRLTRGMAPEVADSLAHCRELLGFSAPVEVYVRPEPVFNAGAIRNPGGGPHIIVISSRLLEVFTPEELRFVIGHEMGHMAFDHFGIPMPATAAVEDMAGQMVSRYNALRLYLWCRSAEITADRVGLVCAGDPVAAASGFFKLASGLSSPRVQTDLEAYATQVESLASAPEARSKPRHDDDTLDCFSTHPYSPLRVRAVVAFSKSRTYRSLTGQGDDGYSDDEVEAIVERDLSLMEPGYLEEKNEESTLMRRMLYCAGVSVAAANGTIEDSELKALRTLLGTDDTWGPVNAEAARAELEQKFDAANQVPFARRAQLVQHLTIVAAADGSVDQWELGEMGRIAWRLGVDPSVIEQTLQASAHPMD